MHAENKLHGARFSTVSSTRRIAETHLKPDFEPPSIIQAVDITDSNTDICVLGNNFAVINYTHWTADVFQYDDSYQPLLNIPIAQVHR